MYTLLYLRGLYLTRKKMKMPCREMGRGPWDGPQPGCGRPVGETVDPVRWPRRGGILPVHSEKHREQTPQVPGDPPRPPQEPDLQPPNSQKF